MLFMYIYLNYLLIKQTKYAKLFDIASSNNVGDRKFYLNHGILPRLSREGYIQGMSIKFVYKSYLGLISA